MSEYEKRELKFIGGALKDLRKFPEKVKRNIGFDLDIVQGV